MRSAAEWLVYCDSQRGMATALEKSIIDDLDAMEKLAIGGEGETHFYYRDAWEADKALIARLVDLVKRYRGCTQDAPWLLTSDADAILDSVKEAGDRICPVCGHGFAVSVPEPPRDGEEKV